MNSDVAMPTPEQRATALLTADQAELQRLAVLSAERLAAAVAAVGGSQIRGLDNALGAGPERRAPQARLAELAAYLAWRGHRAAKSGGGWAQLADQLVAAISDLERQCRAAVEKKKEKEAGYWKAYAGALQTAGARLEIEIIETFVNALARAATARAEDRRK